MAFTPKGLDHVVLRVADLERAVRFYCDVLGCREERRAGSIGIVQLRAGASLIDLIPAERPSGADPSGADPRGADPNMDHFCLRIDPFDEAALRRHLDAHGVAAGALEQRYGAEGQGPSIYLSDPDGNTVELKGPPRAAEHRV